MGQNLDKIIKLANSASGHAMPDGSFHIHDESDLHGAIAAHDYAPPAKKKAIKQHIIKHAKRINAVYAVPSSWWGENESQEPEDLADNGVDEATEPDDIH